MGKAHQKGPTETWRLATCLAVTLSQAGQGCRCVCRGHQVLLDIARGLYFLHKKNILHMDM